MEAMQQPEITEVSLSLQTPLGPNVLILRKIEGQEALSSLFCLTLNMVAETQNIDLNLLIGQAATVTLAFSEHHKRHFHGIIGEMSQGLTDYSQPSRLTHYTAKLYPRLWSLTHTQDCRIFQNRTAREIVAKVLQDHKITAFEDRCQTRGQHIYESCVQYNESYFAFISRLLEQEGIFYFFEHTENDHKLILADGPLVYQDCLYAAEVALESSTTVTPFLNRIHSCQLHHHMAPKEQMLADFNFESPNQRLLSQIQGEGKGGRLYEYSGGFRSQSEGEELTKVRLEEKEFASKSIQGTSSVPFFTAGRAFKLAHHPRADANRRYVLTKVTHQAQINESVAGGLYQNVFFGGPDDIPFRPLRLTPKPTLYGTQTAIVTGKKGEEIWTDKYGRIKVKFHWDQQGQRDETSSCWIRVAQSWAGQKWGVLFTPRVGQEVVVSFLNGDPDQPLVTGCVYNGEFLPPYLPESPTKSTLKSCSSKEGEGHNEICFDDLKGQEHFFIQAQKDLEVTVQGTHTRMVKQGNDLLTLKQGSRIEKLLSESDAKSNYETELQQGDCLLTLVKGDEKTFLKAGNRHIEVQGGDETHTNQQNYTHAVEKDYVLSVKGNLVIDVSGSVTLKGQKIEAVSEEATEIKGGKVLNFGALDINIEAQAVLEAKGNVSSIFGNSVENIPLKQTLKG